MIAFPQASFGVRSFPHVGEERMRDERTPKDVCGEANGMTHSNENFENHYATRVVVLFHTVYH